MAGIKITLKGKVDRDTINGEETAKGKKSIVTEISFDSEEWEAICNRCGKCCFDKLVDQNDRLVAMTPCIYLDNETGLCMVYEERFAMEVDCLKLTPDNILEFGWLPDDCGYITYFNIRRKKEDKR